MAQTWRCWFWKLGQVSFLVVGYAIATLGDCVLAQVTPDGTLGAESSVVTPQAPGSSVDVIEGGATRGANLFHSFEQFSIPTGGEAFFNNALDIQNIISRVTGSSISNIDGLIRANGTANLFLLNPNGINFGSNASLNIGGSFVGSTASSLNFADGTQFSATAPQATPLLTVSVPIGLQYGGTAGSILNQSRATNSNGEAGFAVQPGETLALVGGDVRLDGGRLQAPGGRVELGGIAGSGTVGLFVDGSNQSLSFPVVGQLADVSLTNDASVNVAAGDGGSIAINAQNLNLAGRSIIRAGIASGLGSIGSVAGDVDINTTEAINLTDGSFISNVVLEEAVGNGGNINITAESLSLTDGAQVSASTFGRGNAGSLNVQTLESVELSGTSADGRSSGLFASSEGAGDGGDLRIETGRLNVRDRAEVRVSSQGLGNAGNLEVLANSIGLENLARLSADTTAGQGNIFLRSQDLVLRRGSDIITNTTGTATGGNIIIDTGFIVALENSDITANASQAFGGQIIINTSGIFGTQLRNQLTPESDITTTSFPEFSNTVEINNPNVDPTQGVDLTESFVLLPDVVIDESGLMAYTCPPTGGEPVGSFKLIITGRGGLPPDPREPLNGDNVLTEWNTLDSDTENRSDAAPATNSTKESAPNQIVEANGWTINDKGDVVLTATAPTATLDIPWLPKSGCNAPETSS